MVKARSLLVFSTVSFGLVTLQGGSGGCGGGPSVASCTTDGVLVTLLPGHCAPIPACDSSGYFAGSNWALDAPTLPPHLTVSLRTRPDSTQEVATICAKSSATNEADYSGSIFGVLGDKRAETKLTVHIRGESSMDVELAVEGAPVLNGRTLVSAGKNASLKAVALVGTFGDRTGQWSLVTSSADFVKMSDNLGKGSMMTPANAQLADLGLQLYKPGTTEPSDDVFSLPVRLMKDGDAVVTVRQLQSSYRGIPCPGMSEVPDCMAEILCFSAAGSIVNWPPENETTRILSVTMVPKPSDESREWKRDGVLFAACRGLLTSLEYSVQPGTVDKFVLQIE